MSWWCDRLRGCGAWQEDGGRRIVQGEEIDICESRPVVVRVAGRWLTNCAQSGNEVGDAGACALAHGLRSNRILLELDLVSCVIVALLFSPATLSTSEPRLVYTCSTTTK
jgi:hypothetical protein